MQLVFVLLFDEVTDFFKLDKGVIRIVHDQEVHHLHNMVVKILHLRFVFGFRQQMLEPVVLLD